MSASIHANESAVKGPDDLPPPRDQKRATRKVDPPLSHVSLQHFFYYLAIFAALLSAFYTFELVRLKSDVGGWWNLALGRRPSVHQRQDYKPTEWKGAGGAGAPHRGAGAGGPTVESRIDELAAALGVPSKELASAIASAVHEYVPPASLSSVAAHETGAARHLADPSAAGSADKEGEPGATVARGARAFASVVEAAVGLDGPPSEIEV